MTMQPESEALSARVDLLASWVSEIEAQLRATAVTGREALTRELESFASSVAAESAAGRPQASDEHAAELLAQLSGNLEALEREGVAVAAEISRVESTWAGELGSLAARLDEVAHAAGSASPDRDSQAEQRIQEVVRRLETLEFETASAPAGSGVGDPDELRDIRVLINGLRMRLATSEKELSALSGSGDVVPRLDDLSVRLSLLERTAAAAPQHAPAPGDGRFRVELRGLELRMHEHELAARENRDAVLTQFEKLASRLQWRLQQLETTDTEYGSAASGSQLGQVVPIRSEA